MTISKVYVVCKFDIPIKCAADQDCVNSQRQTLCESLSGEAASTSLVDA